MDHGIAEPIYLLPVTFFWVLCKALKRFRLQFCTVATKTSGNQFLQRRILSVWDLENRYQESCTYYLVDGLSRFPLNKFPIRNDESLQILQAAMKKDNARLNDAFRTTTLTIENAESISKSLSTEKLSREQISDGFLIVTSAELNEKDVKRFIGNRRDCDVH